MNLGIDDQGVPVSQPFLGLDQVLCWQSSHYCCNGTVTDATWKKPQLTGENTPRCRPQLLVCHDMQGGYLDDRFTQGTDNPEAYRFYHWNVIDTFIYFSHCFVTIPPFGWICTAHKHGVNILGTIITEWEPGANICRLLLQSKEHIDAFVSKLLEIMLFYGFDGWLINIENDIEQSDIPLLTYFAQQLTRKCHSKLNHAQVIWYDSVIRSGKLLWQDELNDENEMFFEVCDGIFLNYALTNEKLERTSRKATALNRQYDVYAGVDVFGRCTPGGGGFNSKEIMETINNFGLSCALFAQGWVYQYCGTTDFDANEKKFWSLLNEYLPMKSVSLPLSTCFCHGYGQKFFLEGKVVSENGWHNLSLQQLQPTFSCEMELNDAYIGGGCLKLFSQEADTLPTIKRLFRIFLGKIEPITMSVIWKVNGSKELCDMAFALLSDNEDCATALFLVNDLTSSMDKNTIIQLLSSSTTYKSLEPGNVKFVHSNNGNIEKNNEWIENNFCFDTDCLTKYSNENLSCDLLAILVPRKSVGSSSKQIGCLDSVLLGHLSMCPHQSNSRKDIFSCLIKENCLYVETPCPISHPNLLAIVSHKCFSPPGACTTEDLKFNPNTLGDIDEFNKKMESLKFHNSECKFDDGANSNNPYVSLFLLQWNLTHREIIDYYLIFAHDCSGKEHFVGASVSNYYIINMNNLKLLPNPIVFSLLPIQRKSSLIGQKVFLDSSLIS